MLYTTKIAHHVVVLLVVGILAASPAAPQGNTAPSLQEQLEAQYQLTKINGSTVVPGTPLVILKDGIVSIPLSNPGNLVIKFEDGTLHGPSAAALAQFGKDRRPISKGEKITIITVIGDEDKIRELPLVIMPGVDHVKPIMKPYKLVSRDARSGNTDAICGDGDGNRSKNKSQTNPHPRIGEIAVYNSQRYKRDKRTDAAAGFGNLQTRIGKDYDIPLTQNRDMTR